MEESEMRECKFSVLKAFTIGLAPCITQLKSVYGGDYERAAEDLDILNDVGKKTNLISPKYGMITRATPVDAKRRPVLCPLNLKVEDDPKSYHLEDYESKTYHYYEGSNEKIFKLLEGAKLKKDLVDELRSNPIIISCNPINFVYCGTTTDIKTYLGAPTKEEGRNGRTAQEERITEWKTNYQKAAAFNNQKEKRNLLEEAARQVANGSIYISLQFKFISRGRMVSLDDLLKDAEVDQTSARKLANSLMKEMVEQDDRKFANWLKSMNHAEWKKVGPYNEGFPDGYLEANNIPEINHKENIRVMTASAMNLLVKDRGNTGFKIDEPSKNGATFNFKGYKEEAKIILSAFEPMDEDQKILERFVNEHNGFGVSGRPTIVQLHGPPGTGKTLMAKQVRDQMGVPLIMVQASNMESQWQGEAGRNLSGMFIVAESLGKLIKRPWESDVGCLVFFDEIDSIMMDRCGSKVNSNRMVNIVLKELGKSNKSYAFLGATNTVDHLDSAYMSRVTCSVALKKPEYKDLEDIWSHHAKHLNHDEISTLASLSVARPETVYKRAQVGLVGRDVKQASISAEAEYLSDELKKRKAGSRSGYLEITGPPLSYYIYNIIKQRFKWATKTDEKVKIKGEYWLSEEDRVDDDNKLRVLAELEHRVHLDRINPYNRPFKAEFVNSTETNEDHSWKAEFYQPDEKIPFKSSFDHRNIQKKKGR